MKILSALCVLKPLDCYSSLEGFDTERLHGLIAQSGITGKGWYGLPAYEKWAGFASQSGEKEIVCLISGDCADALMECNAAAVYAGVALTAKAFGMSRVYIVLDRQFEVPESLFGVSFYPYTIERTLSSGEETRVFAAIENDVPIARIEPPYPTEKGLFGRPTLIHSAEFFAHIPYLCAGCDIDTKIIKLCGDIPAEGFCEVSIGTPIYEIADLSAAKAVQIGGVTGRLIPKSDFNIVWNSGDFLIGDGSFRVIGKDRCIAKHVAVCCEQAYPSSCGKCVFCREGVYQQYLLWQDITSGKATNTDLQTISTLAEVMSDNSACGYGQSIGAMIVSALRGFADEIDQHISAKKCPELVCPSMIRVYISPEKCVGCGKCAELCGVNAINGSVGLIHIIDAEKCIRCLDCIKAGCDAITRISARAIVPALPEVPVPVGTFVPKKRGLQRRAK